jgi:dihydrofolate reductase
MRRINQKNSLMKKIALFVCALVAAANLFAQEDDLLKLVGDDKPQKEFVTNAFKSSRVINGHSMEMIAKGNLDFRILHRFGLVNSGAKNFFGLDEASMRMGFDYGILTNLTIGVGRSTLDKELDGFIKFRPVRQSTGPSSFPVSVVLVSGITVNTMPWTDPNRDNHFSSRVGYYHEVIVGRKFSETFSLQVSPTMVHRNLVPLASDENDVFALGTGARFKLSRRIALVADYHHILSGLNKDIYKNPLSVGIDIETGGHVFQLHFSNAAGMNEKAFITNTVDEWGDVRFGFNLSRMFVIKKPRQPKTSE